MITGGNWLGNSSGLYRDNRGDNGGVEAHVKRTCSPRILEQLVGVAVNQGSDQDPPQDCAEV